MRERADLVRGLLRKAESQLVALDASLNAGALDAACFHAQQAAEKYLKAFLTYADVDYPFTHNLAKLLSLCAAVDARFESLFDSVEPLTPYAVELKYDSDFWPAREVAEEARLSAQAVRVAVLGMLPVDLGEAGR